MLCDDIFITILLTKGHTMKKSAILLGVIIILTACDTPTSNPSQNQDIPNQTDPNAVANPDIPIKVDLPIDLYGADSLLHPVVVSAIDEYVDKSGSYSKTQIYSHVSVSDDKISGQMFNLIFENKQTGQTTPLFKNNTQIIHEAYYPVYIKSDYMGRGEMNLQNVHKDDLKHYHHFIYTVQENIGKYDSDSIHAQISLYMSDDKGGNLTKLHPDDEYFIQGSWVMNMERYYFTTKKDSNNDGKIDLYDDSKNYYIDFKESNPMVKAYDFMPR